MVYIVLIIKITDFSIKCICKKATHISHMISNITHSMPLLRGLTAARTSQWTCRWCSHSVHEGHMVWSKDNQDSIMSLGTSLTGNDTKHSHQPILSNVNVSLIQAIEPHCHWQWSRCHCQCLCQSRIHIHRWHPCVAQHLPHGGFCWC